MISLLALVAIPRFALANGSATWNPRNANRGGARHGARSARSEESESVRFQIRRTA
jgi:hypothetical protein